MNMYEIYAVKTEIIVYICKIKDSNNNQINHLKNYKWHISNKETIYKIKV